MYKYFDFPPPIKYFPHGEYYKVFKYFVLVSFYADILLK